MSSHAASSESPGLTHRWFVQYNPLYLISAALVLVGVYLISGDLSRTQATAADLWVTLVTELYQVALITVAALLYRLRGQRRPAVMLALIQVAYMCDLTFETQVAPLRGTLGLVLALGWLALFGAKLRLLVWALRLKASWAVLALPIIGAAALVGFPLLLHQGDLSAAASRQLVCWLVFGLCTAGPWLRPRLSSRESLDDWGTTVLARATAATWGIWLLAFIGHALWWSRSYGLQLSPALAAVLLLLLAAAGRSEARVLIASAGIVVLVALFDPASVSMISAMAACRFLIRARGGFVVERESRSPLGGILAPYRAASVTTTTQRTRALVRCPRMYLWALLSAYLSLWTWGWAGQGVPLHRPVWVVAAWVVLLLALAYRARMLSAAVAAVALGGHLALQQLGSPQGSGQWGATLVAGGIALLFVGLAVNWWLAPPRRHVCQGACPARSGEP